VYDLGVGRAWRGRGIGEALLRHAFGVFHTRGFRLVGLGVDSQNLTGATRLYERAGMRIERQYDVYAKGLGDVTVQT
jgi:ribosomal protein S18 acetylase RimI-like enzyme